MGKTTIEVGDAAPEFTLLDQDGTAVKLGEFKGSWVVLYFYPKDDTPGCTAEACEFTEGIEAFTEMKRAEGRALAGILGEQIDRMLSEQRANGNGELREKLKEVYADEQTSKIVENISDEAVLDAVSQDDEL